MATFSQKRAGFDPPGWTHGENGKDSTSIAVRQVYTDAHLSRNGHSGTQTINMHVSWRVSLPGGKSLNPLVLEVGDASLSNNKGQCSFRLQISFYSLQLCWSWLPPSNFIIIIIKVKTCWRTLCLTINHYASRFRSNLKYVMIITLIITAHHFLKRWPTNQFADLNPVQGPSFLFTQQEAIYL